MFNFVYKNIDFAHKIDPASQPKENYSRHLHYFNEIIFFVKGDVKYTVENKTKNLEEGDIVLIPSLNYHFATVNSKTEYERYILKFPSEFLPSHLIDKMKSGGGEPFFTAQKKYSTIFSQLETYYYGNFSDDDLYALFLCELVKMLILLYKEPTYSPTQPRSFISELIDYIDENIKQPLTLDILSDRFNFSKNYIGSEFRKYMKISIMHYIRAKKIIGAHQLIISGEKKYVAAEIYGFEDYSTFYRSYVKIMGFKPNEIKNRNFNDRQISEDSSS